VLDFTLVNRCPAVPGRDRVASNGHSSRAPVLAQRANIPSDSAREFFLTSAEPGRQSTRRVQRKRRRVSVSAWAGHGLRRRVRGLGGGGGFAVRPAARVPRGRWFQSGCSRTNFQSVTVERTIARLGENLVSSKTRSSNAHHDP